MPTKKKAWTNDNHSREHEKNYNLSRKHGKITFIWCKKVKKATMLDR